MNKTKEQEIDAAASARGINAEDYCIYRHTNKNWYVSIRNGEDQPNRDKLGQECFAICSKEDV